MQRSENASTLMKDETSINDAETKNKRRPWYRKLFGGTFGTATLYLKKPVLPPISEYRNLIMRRNSNGLANGEDNGDLRGAEELVRRDNRRVEREFPGAEVRLLRRVRIWEHGNLKKCPIDLGIGGCISFDPVTKIQPVARIRLADTFTIKLLPERVLKFSKTLPFHFQGMQANLRYELPLSAINESWWRPPARMLVRFEHGSNSGFHLYPGGLEFGDHTFPLTEESKTALRVAAGLSFPREYPARDNPIVWEIHRLGLKTVW